MRDMPDMRARFRKIQELRARGLTAPQIGARLGVSAEVVRWTWWKQRQRMALDAKPPSLTR